MDHNSFEYVTTRKANQKLPPLAKVTRIPRQNLLKLFETQTSSIPSISQVQHHRKDLLIHQSSPNPLIDTTSSPTTTNKSIRSYPISSKVFPLNEHSKINQSVIVEFPSLSNSNRKDKQKIDAERKKSRENHKTCKCSPITFLVVSLILILLATGAAFAFAILLQAPTKVLNTVTTTTTTTKTSTTDTTSTTTTTTSSTSTTTTTTATTTTAAMIIYSENFVTGVTSSSQCTMWNTFRSSLAGHNYTLLTIEGTTNATTVTLTNATHVNAIAYALQANTAYGPVSSNGHSWAVGLCSSTSTSYELTTTGNICSCTAGYTIRPCIGNQNWGGINGSTCGASSQTMTVIFHF